MAKKKQDHKKQYDRPGQPTMYTKELAKEICTAISKSKISIRKLCESNRDKGWPHVDTIMNWRFDIPEFFEQYTKAKQMQMELLVDDTFDLATDRASDILIAADGHEIGNSTAVARDRLIIDTIKWNASKVAPKIYGDAKETIVKTREITELSQEEQVEYLNSLPHDVKLQVFGNFAKKIEEGRKK